MTITKLNIASAVLLTLLASGCATETEKANSAPAAFRTDMDKSSYVQGVRYMESLRQFDIPLNRQAFLQGMDDALAKAPYRLTPPEMQEGQAWVLIQQDLFNEKLAKSNLEKGKAFLAKNRQATGVTVLPDGLQYQILDKGKGKRKPTLNDAVSVRYRISRISGEKLIESGKDETAPSLLLVNNLIKGWQEGLQLMTEGDKCRLFIPPQLAYGDAGAPQGGVGPNETLIYEVELLTVKNSMNAQAKQELRTQLNSASAKKIASW